MPAGIRFEHSSHGHHVPNRAFSVQNLLPETKQRQSKKGRPSIQNLSIERTLPVNLSKMLILMYNRPQDTELPTLSRKKTSIKLQELSCPCRQNKIANCLLMYRTLITYFD